MIPKTAPGNAIKIKTESKEDAEDRINFIEKSITNYAKNFTMSKSECEKFLLSVREDVKSEENVANRLVETTLTTLFERFKATQEKLRK